MVCPLRRFLGTFGSTFSANINRIRGYHSPCLVPDKGIYFVNWPLDPARCPPFSIFAWCQATPMSAVRAMHKIRALTNVSRCIDRCNVLQIWSSLRRGLLGSLACVVRQSRPSALTG